MFQNLVGVVAQSVGNWPLVQVNLMFLHVLHRLLVLWQHAIIVGNEILLLVVVLIDLVETQHVVDGVRVRPLFIILFNILRDPREIQLLGVV